MECLPSECRNNFILSFTEEPTNENELYRAYDHLTTLLLFVGYSRSRHSLVSSLLDAHPHMIVADESYALRKWVSNPDWKTIKSKYDFFDTMMGNSVRSSLHGRRSRDSKGSVANSQIFGYSVPDQWQGAYDQYIEVQYYYSVDTEVQYRYTQYSMDTYSYICCYNIGTSRQNVFAVSTHASMILLPVQHR